MPLPLACLLALSWPSLAAAADRWPACVKKLPKGYDEPSSLDALLACQARVRQKLGRRRPLSGAEADRLDAFQREEVRIYLSRHPRRATLRSEPVEAPPRPSPPPRGKAAGDDIEKLERSLSEKAGDGGAGITPAMARDIAAYLQEKQGGMSGEMSALLDSLQRDGPKLSDESALRLKRAARKAKASGLELGIDPGMERWLLDPAQDPDVALPEPPSN